MNKFTGIWSTSVQCADSQNTGGSEKAVRVSRRMECRFGVIKFHVNAKNKNLYVAWLMSHVDTFMCYSFVELKLKINISSLFNRALNPAHPPLLSSHCWPWGVFSSWLASRDLGTTRSSYLAWMGPVIQTRIGTNNPPLWWMRIYPTWRHCRCRFWIT